MDFFAKSALKREFISNDPVWTSRIRATQRSLIANMMKIEKPLYAGIVKAFKLFVRYERVKWRKEA